MVDPSIASLNSLADVLRQAEPLYSECRLILSNLGRGEGGVEVGGSDLHPHEGIRAHGPTDLSRAGRTASDESTQRMGAPLEPIDRMGTNGPLPRHHASAKRFVEPIDLSSRCGTDPSGFSQPLDTPKQPSGTGSLSCTAEADNLSPIRPPGPSGSGIPQEPFAVPRDLLARYNREELYEKVWTMSVRKVAEEYGVSHSGMGITLKRLHIPIPSVRCWSKKAANKPIPVRPPLPGVRAGNGQIVSTEPTGTGKSQVPFVVSRRLLARFNREELYEKVWMMPMRRVAEEYGLSSSSIAETCKSLHIPSPGQGYWYKKTGPLTTALH